MHNWIDLILKYFKNMLSDIRYIKNLDMSKKEKIYWARYAIIRDWYRFSSSYKAVKYFKYSKEKQIKMDMKLSQQYEQRSK